MSVENDARAKRLALVQEVQHHPLSGKVLHVDFHEVAENEKVTVMVPVETTGEAAGVKNGGGVLEHVLFKLKVRCLPKDLPEQIIVDVSALELGKSIHIGEIKAAGRRRNSGRQEHSGRRRRRCRAPKRKKSPPAEAAAGCWRRGDDQREEGRRRRRRRSGQGREGSAKGAKKAPPKAPRKRRCRRRQSQPSRRSRPRRRNNFDAVGADRQRCAAHSSPRMENVHLIVGLGNPGAEYAKTRHNAGFLLVEKLAARWKADWTNERKFNARIARAERDGKRVLLCQPQTFMNLSGEAVGALVNFYQLPLAQLLVAVDDADLPLGEIRLRPGGSSGGHHGLESIEQHLGTREFARLRIGIGRKDGAREITDYVLGRFDAAEAELVEKVLDRAADQAECWLDAGMQKAMNQFNGVV